MMVKNGGGGGVEVPSREDMSSEERMREQKKWKERKSEPTKEEIRGSGLCDGSGVRWGARGSLKQSDPLLLFFFFLN